MGQKIDLTTQVQGILPVANGGTGGASFTLFADAEVPSGAINGSNGTFVLANIPNPAASLLFFVNRGLQLQGIDYTLVLKTITIAPPAPGSTVYTWYRYLTATISLALSDGISLSDSLFFDTFVPQIPMGLVDSMATMQDQLTSVVFGPQMFFESLVMADSLRIVLLPLAVTSVDFLSMSDALAMLIGIGANMADSLALTDGIMYMYTTPAAAGPDVYVTNDRMAMGDAVVTAGVAISSFAETLAISDSLILQLR